MPDPVVFPAAAATAAALLADGGGTRLKNVSGEPSLLILLAKLLNVGVGALML